ncbi:MAG: tetratricopeptide repeat protein [Caldilineales bacterium]|nr:tetratricopeptide repeat protein [Caldilineales bacterium]
MAAETESRRFPKQTRLTPADDLRQLLEESDKRAVNIKGAGADKAQELLGWLDSIQTLFPQLEGAGVDLEPERGRWQAVQGSVRRHGRELQRELRSLGGLGALRAGRSTPPPPENWWWRLDEIDSLQRRRRIRNLAIAAVAVIVLLVAVRAVVNYLFPVDPLVVEALKLRAEADSYLQAGDIDNAILKLEAARQARPDNSETLSLLVALYAITGRNDESKATQQHLIEVWDKANAYAAIAQDYLLVNRPDEGLRLAEQAVAADPNAPSAYLALGSAYEALGRYDEAINAMETASTVAEQSGQVELQAIARMRLGMLLQQGAILGPTPTN